LPISLLEAMSYRLNILASDINANLELNLPRKCYFNVGNWDELAEKMEQELENSQPVNYNLSHFNWDNIARRTLKIYQKIKKS
jgi:glycosyltransferase involved in cell wall biosynthesis